MLRISRSMAVHIHSFYNASLHRYIRIDINAEIRYWTEWCNVIRTESISTQCFLNLVLTTSWWTSEKLDWIQLQSVISHARNIADALRQATLNSAEPYIWVSLAYKCSMILFWKKTGVLDVNDSIVLYQVVLLLLYIRLPQFPSRTKGSHSDREPTRL